MRLKPFVRTFLQGRQSPLYLINAPSGQANDEDFLLNWCTQAIYEIWHKEIHLEAIKSNQHADCLILSTKEKNYNIEDLQRLNQFINLRPFQASHKFVVFTCLSKLTETHINKCLKVFEEPPAKCSFFILNPNHVKTLATLNSRALQLTAEGGATSSECPEVEVLFKQILEVISGKRPLNQGIADISNDKKHHHQLVGKLLAWATQQNFDYLVLEQLSREIEWFQTSETYYNSYKERWTSLLVHLQKHFT